MATESSAQVSFLVNMLIRSMVDKPDSVSVKATSGVGREIILDVRVDARDVGKLIGLGGRTSRALRQILATISKAQGELFKLDINGQSDQEG